MEQQPTLVERFADNGGHSHWDLIDASNGELLWSGDDELYSDHPQPNREREMKTQWQVKSYTSSLGETGDQFTESWIENGELKLIASSDPESDEELHEIANALNSFETLDQQNKELRERIAVVLSDSALGVEIQRLTTENKELEEKLMSEQIENGYLQAFKVSNEAEIQRLRELLRRSIPVLDRKNRYYTNLLADIDNKLKQ